MLDEPEPRNVTQERASRKKRSRARLWSSFVHTGANDTARAQPRPGQLQGSGSASTRSQSHRSIGAWCSPTDCSSIAEAWNP